jgi:iron complex transport system substrate-binding protein
VKNGRIYEIKSTYILQPGPAALTDGVQRLSEILARVANDGAAT